MVKSNIFYPDTNYIYGAFKKRARELKQRIKPKKRFRGTIKGEAKGLEEKGIHFIISELTEFEIKSRLMEEEGLNFQQANDIFQGWIAECPIYSKQAIKSIKLDYATINWALKHKLKLNDALHILIATGLELYIITKEGNIEKWKDAYGFVFSPEEFQQHLEKLP